ncbi:MAG: SIMPL domain-containing protein [Longimicrobiales bacterium]
MSIGRGRAAVAGGAVALMLGMPVGAAGQMEMRHPPVGPTISVTGTGSVQVPPDQATVLLAVETVAPTAQRAAAENAEKMTRIIDAVRALGIAEEDIRTTSYDLSPIYRQEPRPMPEQEPSEPAIVGYRASNMVEVTLEDIEMPGPVIDAAIDAGANRVAGLTFGIEDPVEARQEALELAVRSARAEAEAVAAAAGVGLGEPITITVGPDFVIPYPSYARMERADMAVATPVQPGDLTVSASVTIVYELRSP